MSSQQPVSSSDSGSQSSEASAEPSELTANSIPQQGSGAPLQGPGLVVLAAAAVLVGRGLGPALPGSRAGIELWIMRLETGTETIPSLGAWLAQLTLLCGSWLCMHFLLSLLSERGLHAAWRTLSTLLGSLLFTIVALANVAQRPLGEGWLLTVALCAASLSVIAGALALAKPTTRASGIVLLLTAAAGLLQVGSRLLALRASIQAHTGDFMTARVGASIAFAINVGTLLFALYWVVHNRSTLHKALSLIALLPGALITGMASAGVREGAAFVPLVAARALNELHSHPDPLLQMPLRNFVEVSAFAVGLLVLSRPRTAAPLRAAIGLALISRANIDVPICALLLACAALLSLSHGAALTRSAPGFRRTEKEQTEKLNAMA